MGASEHTFTGLGTINHQSAQQGAGCQRSQNTYSSGARALSERKELEKRLGSSVTPETVAQWFQIDENGKNRAWRRKKR